MQWRRPGSEFGGTDKSFTDQDSEWRFFRRNISIFKAEISDDLFLVIDQVFRIFPFSSQIFRIFTMLHVLYGPLLKKRLFQKRIPLWHHFLLCSYFRAHPTTLLLKILGGRMHGPSPHLKFWGERPPSPSRSPPLGQVLNRSRRSLRTPFIWDNRNAQLLF